jgi:valyl-tRNA synthetase
MTSFPKKYTKKDLQHLVQAYVEQHPSTSQLFSGFFLPSIQALHLGHFYGLYAKDFLLKQKALYEGKQVQHCLLFQMKPLLSVSDAAQFFAKKRQPLAQLPVMKLRSYLASRREKGIQATTKRLASAFVPYESSREDDSAFAFFLQNVLCSAWEAGKLKRRKSIAYWSVDLQTTIPYHQIDFEKVKVTNYMIKYFVAGKSDTVEISATVPDSIFGDVALLVHPKDKRYQKLVGKRVLIPMVHKSIPVIGDESVDISKHNGIKRVNPTSDFESIALAEKYKLPLDQYVFDAAGNYTEHVGEFKGKSRKEYFANILVFLEDIY